MARSNVIDRFIDADKEPTKTLIPIEGYEKTPLVSLRDAVALIKTPIHNLEKMVWTAERNSEDPSDGLTSNESAAIQLYTMQWPEGYDSFYTLLNERLRSEKRNDLSSWHSYLKLFLTALYKLPSIKKAIWRGICGDVRHLYQKDYIWWGVSSCTETMEAMEKFVGHKGVRTLFMIECINGKSIQSHSHYKDENEIILMPGTYLRVIGKWSPANGLHMIHLQEEIPPHPLLASPLDSSPSSSSVDTRPLEKLTISKPSQLNNQAASAQSYKSKTSTLLSSSPKYKNTKLEQKINENKDKSELWLNRLSLNDNDMEIVAYYLLQLIKKDALYLTEGLQKNIILTTLYLHENQIGDKGAEYLGEGLQNNTTLTELYLHNNQIGDKGAQYLARGLSCNATLMELSLSENQIGMQGAQYLGEGLQKNKTLTRLDLSDNQIGAQGAQYLGEGFQKNKALAILDLSKNQIGAQGAQYFSEVLQKNKTLTTLFLDNNQIGDKGAQYLGEGLQQNKALTKLDLYHNQIGNNGAQYLEKLKKNNRNLSISW